MARIGKIYICISKIEDYIDILKKFGVDTSTYEERLKSILSDNESIIYGNIASEVLKHDTLSDLINLESDIIMNHSSEINLHKDYDSIHTKSLSLYNEISKTKDYDEAKLDLYIGEAKKTIDSVLKLDGISIEAYKKLAHEVYTMVYEIIKFELITRGYSKLLQYVVNDKGIEILNDIIREQIEKMKENKTYDEDVKTVVDRIMKSGFDYSYADEELIFLLILKGDKRIEELLESKKSFYLDELTKLTHEYNETDADIEENEYTIKDSNKKIRKNRNHAIYAAIWILLNTMNIKMAPSNNEIYATTTDYSYTIEAYDTVSDTTKTDTISTSKEEKEYATLKVYDAVDGKGYRDIRVYSIDETDLENVNLEEVNEELISEYIEAITSTKKPSKKNVKYSLTEQLSKDEYATIEQRKLTGKDESFDEEKYENGVHSDYVIYGILEGLWGFLLACDAIAIALASNDKKKAKKDNDEAEVSQLKMSCLISEYKNLKYDIEKLQEKMKDGIYITPEEYKKLLIPNKK